MLTDETIKNAFSIMGRFLSDKKTVGEIAVYGGSAILFQFEWRTATHDVDVTVNGNNHGLVQQASDYAASTLGLDRSWLNEAVTQFTSQDGKRDKLELFGFYPETGAIGLRVLIAKPDYILAMKLAALERVTARDRDFQDAKMLAIEIGITTIDDLMQLYNAYFPSQPLSERALSRLPELEEAIKLGR